MISNKSPFKKFYIFVILAVFVVICLITISKWSIWHDESFSFFLIQYDYKEIITRTATDVHPPLYYLILKTWSYFVGDSLFALRSLGVIFATSAIYINYLWIKKLFNINIALISAVLMSVSPLLIRYAQEMRMYALGMLLASVANWLFVEIVFMKNKNSKYLSLYAVIVALGLYTHYFLIFILAGHAIYLLLDKYKKRELNFKKIWTVLPNWFIVSSIVSLALFAIWIPIMLMQFKEVQNGFWIGPINVNMIAGYIDKVMLFEDTGNMNGWYGILAIITTVLVIAYIIKFFKKFDNKLDSNMLFISVIAFAPPILLLILSIPPLQPAFHERYTVAFLPYMLVVLAIALIDVGKTKFIFTFNLLIVVIIVLTGVVNVSLTGNNIGWSKNDYFLGNKWSEYIKSNRSSSDQIIATSVWTYFDTYYYFRDDQIKARLYAPEKMSKWGNHSLLYDREDLFVKNFDNYSINAKVIWTIDEEKMVNPISDKMMAAGWNKDSSSMKKYGYITITRYFKL